MYDLVIIGATFLGLGAAKGNCLILERSEQIGYEYISCCAGSMDSSPENELKTLILKHNISNIHTLAPLLYSYVKEKKLPILLSTEIIEITRESDGFCLKLYNANGISIIKAKKIIDTTLGTAVSNNDKIKIKEKYINAIIRNKEKKSNEIFSVKLEENTDWCEARQKLHTEFSKISTDNLKIAAVADCFYIKPSEKRKIISENHIIMPSCGYDNPLKAFEEGALIYDFVTKN